MKNNKHFDIAFGFVECINRLDLEGLSELMTDDHRFVDLAGEIDVGKTSMTAGWREYMSHFPEYMIHISEVFEVDDEVLMVGRTTGSHLQIPRKEEFSSEPIIWVAKIRDNKVAEWKLYYDIPKNRARLGMNIETRVTPVN